MPNVVFLHEKNLAQLLNMSDCEEDWDSEISGTVPSQPAQNAVIPQQNYGGESCTHMTAGVIITMMLRQIVQIFPRMAIEEEMKKMTELGTRGEGLLVVFLRGQKDPVDIIHGKKGSEGLTHEKKDPVVLTHRKKDPGDLTDGKKDLGDSTHGKKDPVVSTHG